MLYQSADGNWFLINEQGEQTPLSDAEVASIQGEERRMNQKTDFVNRVRVGVTTLLEAFEELAGEQAMYTALDLGNSLTDEEVAATGITKAELVAAIGSIDALRAVLIQGHNTNLYKVRV